MEVSAPNLGVDYTAGRPLRTLRGRTKIHGRMAANKVRTTRIKRLARGSRRAARLAFDQGLLPSVGFGTQVWGLPPSCEQALRGTFARFVAGPGKGKSHDKVILLHGDPFFPLATAPS